MSRFGEMKYREIADTLEISQKTVEAHMSKAMRLLRDSLRMYRTLMWLLLYLLVQ
jgi:RNA polymerase sigma-70 factor (ECF subfamily)